MCPACAEMLGLSAFIAMSHVFLLICRLSRVFDYSDSQPDMFMTVIPELERMRQEDCYKPSLGYIVSF